VASIVEQPEDPLQLKLVRVAAERGPGVASRCRWLAREKSTKVRAGKVQIAAKPTNSQQHISFVEVTIKLYKK
jgi:hypothetical protein